MSLQKVYPSDLCNTLSDQVLSFRSLLSSEISKMKYVREVKSLLVEDNFCPVCCLSVLSTALQLYLTLPVTTASAEKSISKLSLIKNCLISTMTQTRFNDQWSSVVEHWTWGNMKGWDWQFSLRRKEYQETSKMCT